MNFQFAQQGASFKGAMAYYLHDKREQDYDRNPTTSDRVDWTETRNLITDRAEVATRIMISTAEQASELKARAGIKNTGRKATKPVAAFSLAWHPDEAKGLDRQEMVSAADKALKIMGLEHCQSVIIAHKDTAHPHVHIVVNRVNPEDGRMEKINPNKVRALDRWAHKYEVERGQIFSQNRAEKYDRQDERRKQHPDTEERKRHIDKGRQDRSEKQRAASGSPDSREEQNTTQSRPAALRGQSAALTVRHKAEWKELGRSFGQAKSKVYDEWRQPLKEAYEQHKEDARPVWREHFQSERSEMKTRRFLERSFIGRVSLSIVAAREQKQEGGPYADRKLTTLVLVNLMSKERRDATYEKARDRDRKSLSGELKKILDSRVVDLKGQRSQSLNLARSEYSNGREALVQKQALERAEIRDEWKNLKNNKARDSLEHKAPAKEPAQERLSSEQSPWLDRTPKPQEKSPMRDQKPAPSPERQSDRKPSKFTWLEQQKQKAPDERSRFERSEEGRKDAQGKERDKDDRSR